jgi:uncharacterized protein (TIGR02147 family)
MRSIDIFQFLDYRAYLSAWFENYKKIKGQASYRSFSVLCGISTPNILQQLISRKLNLNQSTIHRIITGLGLKSREAGYFENLVGFDQARSFDERDKYYQRLLKLKVAATAQKIDNRQYRYYSEWYHSAIRALLGYCRFNPDTGDYGSLGRRIQPTLSAQQAESSIKLLLDLGFVTRNSEGCLKQSDPVVSSGPNARSMEIVKYQMETMRRAIEALENVKAGQREISTVTVNISAAGFENIREKIIRTRKEIIEIARADTSDDRVYQCNFQFFPLTKVPPSPGQRGNE